MKKLLIPLVAILFSSCVLTGTGSREVSGSLNAAAPATVKVGLFPPGKEYTFSFDELNDEYGTEKDEIFKNDLSQEKDGSVGTFLLAPVTGLVTTPSGGEYTITFPEDPSTVKCLIAWNDINGDGLFDLGSEDAFLPVKQIDGQWNAVHYFFYIEVVENVTYLAVYSLMDSEAVGYKTLHQDNFDAIGATGFNFNFD